MRIVHLMPKQGFNLKSALKAKERSLRGKGTTFIRVRWGKWKHVRYPGWIWWQEVWGGSVVAIIRTRITSSDWQLLEAFLGYVDRHFGGKIESISIHFRD